MLPGAALIALARLLPLAGIGLLLLSGVAGLAARVDLSWLVGHVLPPEGSSEQGRSGLDAREAFAAKP